MEKNKKRYAYYSGSSKNLEKLGRAVSNHRHALVLDKFAFLSINSNFVLFDRPTENGWFSVVYKDLATMTGYKERTIKSIVKSFEERGLIEKIRKLVNNKCRACIRITEKTKSILGLQKTCGKGQGIVVKKASETQKEELDIKKLPEECTFESAKNAPAYNEKEKKEKHPVNIITPFQGSNKTTTPKNQPTEPYNVPETVQRVFDQVGERMEGEKKKTIWGALCNLEKQHGVSISNPAEFVAWIIFAILNCKHHLKGAETFRHQLNIIMSIAKTGEGFQKPKGFHNHWDIGRKMKQNTHKRDINAQKQKLGEGGNSSATRMEKTPDGQSIYDAVKTSKDWEIAQEEIGLKASRAGVLTQINTLLADNKALVRLFSGDLSLQKKETAKNETKLNKYKRLIREIDEKLASLGARKTEKQQEWSALYEQVG
jgi:hypothetical protein